MDKDYAVVKIGSSQYKVSVGDRLDVQKIKGDKKGNLSFSDVLLTSKKGKISIGTPNVGGAKVEAKILSQFKGKKLTILKYKAKSRYRKRKGHRQQYTKIEIVKI